MTNQDYRAIREQLSKLTPEEADESILKFVDKNCDSLTAEFLARVGQEMADRDQFVFDYALRGCSAAQVMLAMMIIGNKEEPERAGEGVFWLARASALGNGQADHILGSLYASGLVLEQDILKARNHLEKAADLNLPKSQYMLSVFYLDNRHELDDLNLAPSVLHRKEVKNDQLQRKHQSV